MSSPSTSQVPSLLSRLSPAIQLRPEGTSDSSPPTISTSPTPNPRTRVRGSRQNRNTIDTNGATTTRLKGTKSHPEENGMSVRGNGNGATKAFVPGGDGKQKESVSADIGASRWANSPPRSPPRKAIDSTMPNKEASPLPPPILEPASEASPRGTKETSSSNSESLTAIETMLARLRTSPTSPKSTSTSNPNPKPKPSAVPSQVPISKPVKPVLGGRSMWADDDDDDQHSIVPESYRMLNPVVEPEKKPTSNGSVPVVAALPKPTIPARQAIPSSSEALEHSPNPPPVSSTNPPPVLPPAVLPISIAEPTRPSTPPPAISKTSLSPPSTPSQHIDWADDEEDDGELPELEDDWLIASATATTTTSNSNLGNAEGDRSKSIVNERPGPNKSTHSSGASNMISGSGTGRGRGGARGRGSSTRGGVGSSTHRQLPHEDTSPRKIRNPAARSANQFEPVPTRSYDPTKTLPQAPAHLRPQTIGNPSSSPVASTPAKGRGRPIAGPSANLFGRLTGLPGPGMGKDGDKIGARGRGRGRGMNGTA